MSDETQEEALEHVLSRIGCSVFEFCRGVYGSTLKTFHAGDLHEAVAGDAQIAPASADRILRALRQKGVINYRVLSRKESLYEVTSIGGNGNKN
jgi:hypothetical protein